LIAAAADTQTKARSIVDGIAAAGIDVVASMPDSQITPVIRLVTADPRFVHVPLTREDDGVGVCAGAYLAGRSGCLLVQNSGLLEAYNDLLTVGVASEIPMLLLVGYRGSIGEVHWYHGPAGRVTELALELAGIRFALLDDASRAADVIGRSQTLARAAMRPVAVLMTLDALGIGR
jgi:sulfopyruvate decarboxylase subunit alpha